MSIDICIFSSLLALSATWLSYHKGYFTSLKEWTNLRFQQAKFIIHIMNNICTNGPSTCNISFQVNDSDLSADITYQRIGQQYRISVPYHRKYVASMSQFKVCLIRTGKDSVNITQQPGIPYMICANDLGGDAIIITNEEIGISHTYEKTCIPYYGREVMFTE